MRLLLLFAVSLFCMTCLVACQNTAPADQLTVVQGTVTSAQTGRPLREVLMRVEPYSRGFNGNQYRFAGDSVRTNAQGKYNLQFYNKKGLYYAVSLEPFILGTNYMPRYTFPYQIGAGGLGANQREATLGRSNTVDFQPVELRIAAVRIRNLNTGYQRLDFNYKYLRGNNLDTTAYLRGFYFEGPNVKFHYYKLNAAGNASQDTSVAWVLQNPNALPPDTLRAMLTFIR